MGAHAVSQPVVLIDTVRRPTQLDDLSLSSPSVRRPVPLLDQSLSLTNDARTQAHQKETFGANLTTRGQIEADFPYRQIRRTLRSAPRVLLCSITIVAPRGKAAGLAKEPSSRSKRLENGQTAEIWIPGCLRAIGLRIHGRPSTRICQVSNYLTKPATVE